MVSLTTKEVVLIYIQKRKAWQPMKKTNKKGESGQTKKIGDGNY